MLRTLVERLDRAAVGATGLGALADRVAGRLLPGSIAEASSITGCFDMSCSCFAGANMCSMMMWCPGGPTCGHFCGACEDIP